MHKSPFWRNAFPVNTPEKENDLEHWQIIILLNLKCSYITHHSIAIAHTNLLANVMICIESDIMWTLMLNLTLINGNISLRRYMCQNKTVSQDQEGLTFSEGSWIRFYDKDINLSLRTRFFCISRVIRIQDRILTHIS